MKQIDYYRECLADAAAECALALSAEQLDYMAKAVQNGADNIGQAFYQPESPYPAEIKKLEAQLRKEKSKIPCKECGGKGSITTHGPVHSGTGSCHKCNGEGKVLP